jgi:YfiH family protein
MHLPAPDPAFHWSRESWGDALRCEALDAWAQHVFTTRQLQLRPGEDQSAAWTAVAQSVGATPARLLRVKQVHGRTVRVVKAEDFDAAVLERPDADALISNAPRAVLVVQVADCVPMLMVAPRVHAAAAVHAGWRGTVAGIGRETVHALAREFGAAPHELIVAMGPSIGPCCYEVGPELRDAFRGSGASEAEVERWFRHGRGDSTVHDRESMRLDLWEANRDQLTAAGVPPTNIHVSQLCTRTHADVFESYRAEGAAAGRMAAAIRVPHV